MLSFFYFPFICRVANITRVSVYQAAVEQEKAIKGWPRPPSVSSGSTIMTALYRFTRFNRVASLSFWNFRAKSYITFGQNRTWKTKKPLLFLHFFAYFRLPRPKCFNCCFSSFLVLVITIPVQWNSCAVTLLLSAIPTPAKLQSCLISEFYVFSTLFSASFSPSLSGRSHDRLLVLVFSQSYLNQCIKAPFLYLNQKAFVSFISYLQVCVNISRHPPTQGLL